MSPGRGIATFTIDDRRTMMTAEHRGNQEDGAVCSKEDFQCRLQKATARCKEQISWYEDQKHKKRIWYRLFQNAVIVLSGLAPLLILWGNMPAVDNTGWVWLDEHRPPALIQALPAALASMLAAIMSTYRWREEWSRFGFTAESLKSELVKFETRTTKDYSSNDETALNTFVTKIEALAATEVTDWRAVLDTVSEITPHDADTAKSKA
jgi:hypothetical protein